MRAVLLTMHPAPRLRRQPVQAMRPVVVAWVGSEGRNTSSRLPTPSSTQWQAAGCAEVPYHDYHLTTTNSPTPVCGAGYGQSRLICLCPDRFGRSYGVVTAFAKGLASQQPPCCKTDALEHAMRPDCFNCILGTGGFKPAVTAQQGRNEPLVTADTPYQQVTHHDSNVSREDVQVRENRHCRPVRHLPFLPQPPTAVPESGDAGSNGKTHGYDV